MCVLAFQMVHCCTRLVAYRSDGLCDISPYLNISLNLYPISLFHIVLFSACDELRWPQILSDLLWPSELGRVTCTPAFNQHFSVISHQNSLLPRRKADSLLQFSPQKMRKNSSKILFIIWSVCIWRGIFHM